MTPEAQRIAIAEVCGWKKRTTESWEFQWMNPVTLWSEDEPYDYLSDLNAMHEAEKVLNDEQWEKYMDFVEMKCGFSVTEWSAMHATAAQRAEAFLRTLNLWDDAK